VEIQEDLVHLGTPVVTGWNNLSLDGGESPECHLYAYLFLFFNQQLSGIDDEMGIDESPERSFKQPPAVMK